MCCTWYCSFYIYFFILYFTLQFTFAYKFICKSFVNFIHWNHFIMAKDTYLLTRKILWNPIWYVCLYSNFISDNLPFTFFSLKFAGLKCYGLVNNCIIALVTPFWMLGTWNQQYFGLIQLTRQTNSLPRNLTFCPNKQRNNPAMVPDMNTWLRAVESKIARLMQLPKLVKVTTERCWVQDMI